MDNTIPAPAMSPEEWLVSLSLPRHRSPRITRLFNRGRRNQLRDIAPLREDGIMRWPNGDVWIPEPTPPWKTRRFGRPTRTDWRNHAIAGASQVRALAREAASLEREVDAAVTKWLNDSPDTAGSQLISRAQADEWAGRPLTSAEFDRLTDCIPRSSIPDAVSMIVDSWLD
jgi:hypothetical protein